MPGIAEKAKSLGILQQRKSPIGRNEYTVSLDTLRKLPGVPSNALGITDPETGDSYLPEGAPGKFLTHERIHQAQFRQNQQPSLPELAEALRQYYPNEDALRWEMGQHGVPDSHLTLEAPAYAFQEKSYQHDTWPIDPRDFSRAELQERLQQQQEAYNRYIDLMYRLNGSKANSIEAVAPTGLEMDYIRNHPRPYLPPDPNMKEVNIFTGK